MKKSKLSKSLVAGFIAAMSLSACSPVQTGNNAIVTFTDANGKEVSVITESMYNDALEDNGQVSTLYEKILEVFIRNYFEKGDSSILPGVTVTTSLETIKAKAETNLEEQKEKAAKDSAGYAVAWKNILESYGLKEEDGEEGLRQKFIYDLEKEALEKAFNKANKTELAKQFIGVVDNGQGQAIRYSEKNHVEKTDGLPYHIQHILIKTQDDNHNYSRDKISSSVAEKLSNVVIQLATGNMTFNQVAAEYSDDTSNKEFGDVGIVSNSASTDGNLSMVAEFQLGLYAFDNIFARAYGTNDAEDLLGNKIGITSGLGLESETRIEDPSIPGVSLKAVDAYKLVGAGNLGETNKGSLVEVPYEVFEQLGEVYDKESVDNAATDESQIKLSTNESLYPRNILWNKYLNRHDVFVISNRKINDYSAVTFDHDSIETLVSGEKALPEAVIDEWDDAKVATLPGFRAVETGSPLEGNLDMPSGTAPANRSVLYSNTDATKGQVIFGMRSNYGIHLLTIEKSINDFAIKGGSDSAQVSLEEYYTTEIPTTSTVNEKYPSYNGKYKDTYVNFIDNETTSNFNTRAETVENKITSFDSTTQYMLYEALYNAYDGNNKLKFNKDVNKTIEKYIADKRQIAFYSQEENIADAWSNYVELLEAQYEARSLGAVTKNNQFGLIPQGCIIAFNHTFDEIKDKDEHGNSVYDLYKEGGVCYYA